MKIVLAPNAFKQSLSAIEAATKYRGSFFKLIFIFHSWAAAGRGFHVERIVPPAGRPRGVLQRFVASWCCQARAA